MNADGSKIGKGKDLKFELYETDLIFNEKAYVEAAMIMETKLKKVTNNKVSLPLTQNGK